MLFAKNAGKIKTHSKAFSFSYSSVATGSLCLDLVLGCFVLCALLFPAPHKTRPIVLQASLNKKKKQKKTKKEQVQKEPIALNQLCCTQKNLWVRES